MKKSILYSLIFLLCLIFFSRLFSLPVLAQSTCEICGYCEGKSLPSNWGNCVQCLYPAEQQAIVTEAPERALLIAPTIFATSGDKAYTVFGCVSTTQSGFIDFFANFLTSLVVGLAFLGILWGGLKVMTARGDREALEEGKRYIYGSIAGLLIVFFATFIVKTIGIQILKIPFLQ